MSSEDEARDLLDLNPPEWEIKTLLSAAEAGVSWLFLLTLEEGRPQLSRMTEGFREVVGLDPEALFDFSQWKHFLNAEDHERLSTFFQSLPRSERVHEIECTVLSRGSFPRAMKVSARRHHGLIVGSFRDITSEKNSEEGLQRQYQLLTALFTAVPVPIFFCDEDLRVLETNLSGAIFLGQTTPAQAFGFSLRRMLDIPVDVSPAQLAQESQGGVKELILGLKPEFSKHVGAKRLRVRLTEIQTAQKNCYALVPEKEDNVEVPSERTRYVVVEDIESTRTLLLNLLRKLGIEAEGYESAEKFEKQLTELQDLVLFLDYHLPGISGAELARKLRSSYLPTQIPLRIYLVTSNLASMKPDEQQLFDQVLEKPVDLNQIRNLLRQDLKAPFLQKRR